MKYPIVILATVFWFFTENALAQIGYQKDSLQIKVYSEIDYVQQRVKEIRVKKVFCDYCTKFQKEAIAEEAYRRTYLVRNDTDVKLVNGTYKHALYIRISKKDFAEIKQYGKKQKDSLHKNKNKENKEQSN